MAGGCQGRAFCFHEAGEGPAQITGRYSASYVAVEPVPITTFSASTVVTYLAPASADLDGGQWSCISAGLAMVPVELKLDCPPGPGKYQLKDLNAVACDGSCGPVDGVLTVRTFSRPCGLCACGRLDADLTLSPVASGDGPQLTGSATLDYQEAFSSGCWPPGCQ